ncbi:AAA family ATPase [uncultured Ruminococcus sp.]|uniref:AAA family ATPase n=1 Tax=uncultured Ruminococcus sp. TaxID=165186 RepID=UPI0025EB09AC|nr:AAA family ATPase [uncultured Ruminococcus sp.]
MGGGYIRSIELFGMEDERSYIADLPAVKHLADMGGLSFDNSVTFLVGENGTGKSTLLEGIAVAFGFNPEGGSRNFSFATNETHSPLYEHLRVIKSFSRPRDGFFLRAESFYNAASYIDSLGSRVLNSYGGVSLHEMSHGESFFALVMNRFRGDGLYILDEPEAALSPQRQMGLLIRMNKLVQKNSQFIIATHSPVLLAYPDALIYELDEREIARRRYEETETVSVSKAFLNDPKRMIAKLFGTE